MSLTLHIPQPVAPSFGIQIYWPKVWKTLGIVFKQVAQYVDGETPQARSQCALTGFETCPFISRAFASLPGLTPLGAAAFVGCDAMVEVELLDNCKSFSGFFAKSLTCAAGDFSTSRRSSCSTTPHPQPTTEGTYPKPWRPPTTTCTSWRASRCFVFKHFQFRWLRLDGLWSI